VEEVCLKIGAKPTTTKPDGRPHYTLPVIYDPTTKLTVSDAENIVRYLETQYPDTPSLFPPGTHGLIAAFKAALWAEVPPKLFGLAALDTLNNLSPRAQVGFRRSREMFAGATLEQICPVGEEAREGRWKAAENSFDVLASWYDLNGRGSLFIAGNSISYADVMMASFLV